MRQRLLGAGFVLLLVTALTTSVLVYRRTFTPTAWVTLRTDHTGMQLNPGADVKLRGVVVGDVRDVSADGQAATLRLLTKAFEKAQIEEINPEGQTFNPELHEAMMAQPSDAPPNTVLAVIQRGYQLNGRLLRPARVVVSAAKN